MVRELYQRLREYFNNLPEPTEEERQFIRELNAGYFPITSVHRDDLEGMWVLQSRICLAWQPDWRRTG